MRPSALLWWFVVGALYVWGFLGMLSIGVPLLLLALVSTVVGALLPQLRGPEAGAALVGAATGPAFVAWSNRHGPGTWCETSTSGGGTMTSCTEQWAPWPFAVAALVLLGLGAAAFVAACRRRPAAG